MAHHYGNLLDFATQLIEGTAMAGTIGYDALLKQWLLKMLKLQVINGKEIAAELQSPARGIEKGSKSEAESWKVGLKDNANKQNLKKKWESTLMLCEAAAIDSGLKSLWQAPCTSCNLSHTF